MSAAVLTFVILGVCAFGTISSHDGLILQKLLSTLEKLVDFYKKAYTQMNVDGIFGLRTLEGKMACAFMHPIPEFPMSHALNSILFDYYLKFSPIWTRAAVCSCCPKNVLNDSYPCESKTIIVYLWPVTLPHACT